MKRKQKYIGCLSLLILFIILLNLPENNDITENRAELSETTVPDEKNSNQSTPVMTIISENESDISISNSTEAITNQPTPLALNWKWKKIDEYKKRGSDFIDWFSIKAEEFRIEFNLQEKTKTDKVTISVFKAGNKEPVSFNEIVIRDEPFFIDLHDNGRFKIEITSKEFWKITIYEKIIEYPDGQILYIPLPNENYDFNTMDNSEEKTVKVRGHFRNGTWIDPYERSKPKKKNQ